MSVLIGISALEHARYTQFTECLGNLEKPPGSRVVTKTGIDIGINRRDIVREALEANAEWVFFLDDDMLFPPDHLTRLLAHEQPVVASLYLTRKPPHFAVAYNEYVKGEGWRAVTLEGAPQTGLSDVVAAGTGGMLVRTDVFRRIEEGTWFLHEDGTEDLPFCARVIEAGFPIYLDLEARMGHLSTYAIWPEFTTSWVGAIKISNTKTIRVLLEKP
jgi:GT2 family glycosyltransferase